MRTALAVLLSVSALTLVWCPWSVAWLSYKAYRAHVTSDFDEAVRYYTRVIERNPRDAWAYGNRSLVYRALGNHAAAAGDEAVARTIDPSFDFE
jgi:tetratricopeptide (TPR) repeat protein